MTAPPSTRNVDRLFYLVAATLGGSYVLLIVLMLAADVCYTRPADFFAALSKPEIQYSVKLTLASCTIAAILSIWVAAPLGYLLSRCRFPGKKILDALLDVPIVLPPLVIGLSLLILFHLKPFELEQTIRNQFGPKYGVSFKIPAVILAQFAVACAFAVRTMRVTFDQINPRAEQVALTLGCSRGRAFFEIILPQAWKGLVTAFTLAWARSLGEFGPILVFAGSTRMRTEVLSTSVFLELSAGKLESAVAVSLVMVAVALVVLVVVRTFGVRQG